MPTPGLLPGPQKFLLGLLRRLGASAALGLVLVFCFGCSRVPQGRTSVDEITVRGNDEVDEGDIADKIATAETEKFLGLFRGVLYDYSLFDRNVLQRDLARVESFYREKGFYEAHARAGRVHTIDAKHVRVEIIVEEGKPVNVENVRIDGLETVPKDIAALAQLNATRTLRKGRIFTQENFDAALATVRRTLTDRGYAYAKVKNEVAIDIVRHQADVVLTVTPGGPCRFGDVTIVGLGPLPEASIRRTLDIEKGAVYSEAVLDSAQQAVLDLGVLASVDVKPDLPEPPQPDGVVPIKVTLEPSRLRTVKLGGGVEFDLLKTDLHAITGWEHRNFFGGLRTFSVNFRPGVVLYPLRFNNFVVPSKFLPEEKLRLEFKQPGFIEARTNAFIRPEFNIQPLILPATIKPKAGESERVLGYAEFRNGVGLERTYWKFNAQISHNLQVAYPFQYVGSKDPTLSLLIISYPELVTTLDFRNDRVHPRRGLYISNSLQVAGGPFGGQAMDVKVQPDVRGYIPITKKRVVLALRGSLGLLFPSNYGDVVRNPTANAPDSEMRTHDFQLTFFRGFFSGGPTSNRGYPLRGIGPFDKVPFLSPEFATQQAATKCGNVVPGEKLDPSLDCRAPTGGFTLWEASAEVRIKVSGPLSVAVFCDGSDVSPRTVDIRPDHLHLSCGPGGRYDTPVGPVRLDVGYRIPGLQTLSGVDSREREPETFIGGIPIAVSLGIGEAY